MLKKNKKKHTVNISSPSVLVTVFYLSRKAHSALIGQLSQARGGTANFLGMYSCDITTLRKSWQFI